MVYEPLYHALQTITLRVCSNLKTSWKSVVFTNKVGKTLINSYSTRACGIWDYYSQLRTARLVGYLLSHISPTRTRGIIVKYILRKLNQISVKIELLIQNIVGVLITFPCCSVMFRACGILLFLLCFQEALVFAIFRSSSWTAEQSKTPSLVPFSKQ